MHSADSFAFEFCVAGESATSRRFCHLRVLAIVIGDGETDFACLKCLFSEPPKSANSVTDSGFNLAQQAFEVLARNTGRGLAYFVIYLIKTKTKTKIMTMCETYINFTEDFSYRLSEKRRMGWSRNGKTKSYICELYVFL